MPLGHTGRWMTDADGRVVVLHGLNQVYKVPPYTPSADGFGDDDAAFLQANGFNAMRVGVIWAAVEPQPLNYDDNYLPRSRRPWQTLASHGIVSLLDFHQDMYNEVFQGEGAPPWAVKTGGLPNPQLGFPGNYFLNPAEEFAWSSFWRNAPRRTGLGCRTTTRAPGRMSRTSSAATREYSATRCSMSRGPDSSGRAASTRSGLPDPGLETDRLLPQGRAGHPCRRPDHAGVLRAEHVVRRGNSHRPRQSGRPATGFSFHDYCAIEAELRVTSPAASRTASRSPTPVFMRTSTAFRRC